MGMSKSAAAITHTGDSLTVSSDVKVLIESVTFIAGAVSTVTSIGMSGDITMSNDAAAITHSGNSQLTISSDVKVLIESVTFIAGAVSTVTSIGMSDDITMSKGISKITHSGTGGSDKLHIESTSKSVQIEGVTFTGSAITGAGAITSNGALT